MRIRAGAFSASTQRSELVNNNKFTLLFQNVANRIVCVQSAVSSPARDDVLVESVPHSRTI